MHLPEFTSGREPYPAGESANARLAFEIDLRRVERPVVFFSNAIGDTLLALPTLRALSHTFAGRLSLICDSRSRDLCYHELRVCRTIEIPGYRIERPNRLRTFDVERLSAAVGETDLFISLVPWRSPSLTALIEKLSPAGVLGFYPDADFVVRPVPDLHSADLAFRIARRIGPSLRLEDFAGPPRLPEAAKRFARDLRQTIPEWARVLVVHPDTEHSKCWSAGNFVRMLDGFLARRPDFITWIVGLSYGALDAGQYGERVISCLGLPLAETVALVGQADLFVGVDSCMLHAADLFRVPGVGLFGPTNVAEWGFRFGPHRHIQGPGSLAPVSVHTVLEALDDLLEMIDQRREPEERVAARLFPRGGGQKLI
jgi:ADP-heptose:LPS heptosyltransferase